MTLRQIRLTLPMPPNASNRASGRGHWRTIHREKKQYMALCDALQSGGMIPPPPEVPFRLPLLSSTMHVGAKHDLDNAVSRHKSAIDWLATRGYIVNDRDLEWHAFPRQIIKRGAEYRLELVLTERASSSLSRSA
jgi:hypothetical protein